MKDKKNVIGKYLFEITVVLWFSSEIILNSTVEYVFFWEHAAFNKAMAVIVLGLLLVEILFFQNYSSKELMVWALIMFPILLGTIISGSNSIISTMLFVIAAKNMEFDRVAKLSHLVLMIMIPVVLYLFFSGRITEVTFYRESILRHSWGFVHPNWLGMRVFQFVISYFYLKKYNLKLFDFAFIIASLYFVYRIPNCKTAYYALGVLLVLIGVYFFLDFFENGRKVYEDILVGISIFANLFSVFMSLVDLKSQTFLKIIDRFLSRRFSNCHTAMKVFGIHLFGEEIDLHVKRMNSTIQLLYLDNAYMTILLRYGALAYLGFSLLFFATVLYCKKKAMIELLTVLCLYSVYGIMEKNFFMLTQNIFLLTMSFPIYNTMLENRLDKVEKSIRKRKIRFVA